MEDLFAPLHFTNIPHDISERAIDRLPSFTGNDATIATDHIKRFTTFLARYAHATTYNHEDVKMQLFILSLEGDARNWFCDFPDNFFDSLQAIINAFKNRYGDQINERYLPCAIYNMKTNENGIGDQNSKLIC